MKHHIYSRDVRRKLGSIPLLALLSVAIPLSVSCVTMKPAFSQEKALSLEEAQVGEISVCATGYVASDVVVVHLAIANGGDESIRVSPYELLVAGITPAGAIPVRVWDPQTLLDTTASAQRFGSNTPVARPISETAMAELTSRLESGGAAAIVEPPLLRSVTIPAQSYLVGAVVVERSGADRYRVSLSRFGVSLELQANEI